MVKCIPFAPRPLAHTTMSTAWGGRDHYTCIVLYSTTRWQGSHSLLRSYSPDGGAVLKLGLNFADRGRCSTHSGTYLVIKHFVSRWWECYIYCSVLQPWASLPSTVSQQSHHHKLERHYTALVEVMARYNGKYWAQTQGLITYCTYWAALTNHCCRTFSDGCFSLSSSILSPHPHTSQTWKFQTPAPWPPRNH